MIHCSIPDDYMYLLNFVGHGIFDPEKEKRRIDKKKDTHILRKWRKQRGRKGLVREKLALVQTTNKNM